MKYIVNYFNSAGKAEAARLLFVVAGVEFYDNRMEREQWHNERSDEKRFPLGQLPTLQVDDKVICQSNAIYRYLATEFGLYGDNSTEKAGIDEVFETLNDIISCLAAIVYDGYDAETKKAKFSELFGSETYKQQMRFINNVLKNNNGGNGFLVGNKLSVADINFYCVANFMLRLFCKPCLDDFPDLIRLSDRIAAVDSIKRYYDSKKFSECNKKKYIVNYFNSGGKAEAARLLFVVSGVKFHDNRMEREQWNNERSDKKRFPLGQLPTLQVDDKVICQSNAIYRYLATEFGLYGDNSMEKAGIDEVFETLNDIISCLAAIVYGGHDAETRKAKFSELFGSETYKQQMRFINNVLKNNNGGNGFLVGNKLSVADINFYCVANFMLGLFYKPCLDDFPELVKLNERIAAVDSIKRYYDSKK